MITESQNIEFKESWRDEYLKYRYFCPYRKKRVNIEVINNQ